MNRPMIRVLIVIVAALVCGCDRPEVDVNVTCDQYFLSEISPAPGVSTKVFYNSENRISAIDYSVENHRNRADYIYDLQGRLTEVRTENTNSLTEFRYDANGRLIATLRYPTGLMKLDSFAIEYDASGRISKRSIYTGSNDAPVLESYFVVEYPEPARLEFKYYKRKSASGPLVHMETWVFVVDDKPMPRPIECYYYELAWTNVLLPHNPVSFRTFRGEDGMPNANEVYKYEYNEAGYPIQEKSFYGTTAYSYSCTPPTE